MGNMMGCNFHFHKYVVELDIPSPHGVRSANFPHPTAKNDRLETNPHGNAARV